MTRAACARTVSKRARHFFESVPISTLSRINSSSLYGNTIETSAPRSSIASRNKISEPHAAEQKPERGELPVGIAGSAFHFFQTLLANFSSQLIGLRSLANEQIHCRGIDSGPITAACSVCFGVSLRSSFQKLIALTRCCGCDCEIFIGSPKHPKRFFG